MCLYPRLIKNPKYKPNKKNGGRVPPILDSRVLAVPIGCGKCLERDGREPLTFDAMVQVQLLE